MRIRPLSRMARMLKRTAMAVVSAARFDSYRCASVRSVEQLWSQRG